MGSGAQFPPVGSKHPLWTTLEGFLTPSAILKTPGFARYVTKKRALGKKLCLTLTCLHQFAYRRATSLASTQDLATANNQSHSFSPLTRGGINLILIDQIPK